MADQKPMRVKAIINDLTSKIGRKGNRFCEFKVRLPTNAAEIQQLVLLQGMTVQMDMVQLQEKLFVEDE